MGRIELVKDCERPITGLGGGQRWTASLKDKPSRSTFSKTTARAWHTRIPKVPFAWACSALLAACGNSPPSTDQANETLKEMPQMHLLLGDEFNNPSLHLVSDMTCDKSGDHKFKCQVLLPKNPFNGSQETMPVEFVKLDGKWRAVPEG